MTMEAVGFPGMELRARQNAKRKRLEEADSCVPAKRPLTEETMAAFMHQLNLSTTSSSPISLPLNITSVTTCTASTAAGATYYPNEALMRGSAPSSHTSHNQSPPNAPLTPPLTSVSPVKPPRVVGSSVTEGLDLADSTGRHSVHIRVTPATPPSSESTGSPSHGGEEVDGEPMEQSSLSHGGKRRGVVLDDISSDSSDGEMSQRVWIAPELQNITAATQRHLLPTPVINEIARNGMAVVPWVNREQYLTRFLSRAQDPALSSDDSGSEEEELGTTRSQRDMQYWEQCSMYSD